MRRLSQVVSLALGTALAVGMGCTIGPPDSVLESDGRGADARTGGAADGEVAGGPDAGPSGPQSVTVTFTTQPVGNTAQYAPTNIVATWIEDANGTFIETINRQSDVRSRHLIGWIEKSGGADVDQDALTGATRPNHATPITATWNIPADVPDGTYTIRIETCDENSNTAGQNTQGTFTFEKNGTASMQAPVGAGYTNVSIDYSGSP